ncbi:MAG: DUF11 domain-containing protein, partial [Planctomycetaceae bacterium]|nr:DUF11 domain-containing protein [Planctomycetaceae bacterium]
MVLRNWLSKWRQGDLRGFSRPGKTRRKGLIEPEALETRVLLAATADLELSQTVNAPNPGLGSTVTFTVTLLNNGPNTTTGITVANAAPAGLTGVTFTPSDGTYSAGVWSIANLQENTSATLTITGTVVTAGNNVTNVAEVTASGKPDPDSTPNNGVTSEDDYTTLTQHINDAPTLTVSGAAFLDSISVNVPNANNLGTLVSTLISRLAPGGISDTDVGDSQGIAINGTTGNLTGTWEFSTDGGSSWSAVGPASNDSARLLASDANTRIRYVPNTGFKGTAKIAFVAWDQTAGTNGGTGVTKFRIGASPFSLAYDLATISVTNSAPVLDNSGNPTLVSIPVNAGNAPENMGTTIEALIASSAGITDSDPGAQQGIAINGLVSTHGTWEYTVNNGTNWTPVGTTGNSDARLLAADGNTRIRFVPDAQWTGTAKIAFVAWDRTTGSNGGTANVGTRGGSTAFSVAYEYASITVTNAAPVLNVTNTAFLDSIPTDIPLGANTGTLVSDIIARSGGITDPDPAALQGIAINGLGNTATGDWQYTVNGGTSWHLIGTTGNSNARLLAADPNTRIRYVPQVGYQGTAIFSFVAWDRTTGSNGGTAGVGTRGGTTPYSTDYDYASISIVNAAPVLNDAGNPLLDGILPNIPDVSNTGTLVSDLIYRMGPTGGITDANPYALRGIAIIGKSGSGTWEFSTNNGSSWSTINATGGANALLLASDSNTRIRYRPALNFVGEAKIAFVAWDQTSGTNGAVANASTRGGLTAY